MPVWTFYIATGRILPNEYLCITFHIADHVFAAVTCHPIFYICLDRYLTLKYPFTFQIKKDIYHNWILFSIWLINIIVILAGIIGTQFLEPPVHMMCDLHYEYYVGCKIFAAMYASLLPVSLTAAMFCTILRMTKKIKAAEIKITLTKANTEGNEVVRIEDTLRETNSSDKSHANSKAVKTIGLLLLVYVTTWLPFGIHHIVTIFNENIPEYWVLVAYWLSYLGSTLNPVCYAIGNPVFRDCLFRVLRRDRERFLNYFKS